jgi:A/G-specific adenine glycosylase
MFSAKVISWYNANKRQLPWRDNRDPYRIWISEIVLQQTRVDQGISYYFKLLQQYPNVYKLAHAHIDQVLRVWQGLGYYSRARNLHATAQKIAFELDGQFPDNYHDLLKLKGIGEYTAAAIASFAFKEAVAVVDGNVSRIISRLYGIEQPIDTIAVKKRIKEAANKLIDKNHPDTYNQAIMDFGALQCIPSRPNCMVCIVKNICQAHQKGITKKIPVKTPKKKTQIRFFNYLVIYHQGKLLFNQRKENDIWKLLYEFPLIETKTNLTPTQLIAHSDWKHFFETHNVKIHKYYSGYTQKLTHQQIFATFFLIYIDKIPVGLKSFQQVPLNHISDIAIPRLIERFILKSGFFK